MAVIVTATKGGGSAREADVSASEYSHQQCRQILPALPNSIWLQVLYHVRWDETVELERVARELVSQLYGSFREPCHGLLSGITGGLDLIERGGAEMVQWRRSHYSCTLNPTTLHMQSQDARYSNDRSLKGYSYTDANSAPQTRHGFGSQPKYTSRPPPGFEGTLLHIAIGRVALHHTRMALRMLELGGGGCSVRSGFKRLHPADARLETRLVDFVR